MEEVEDLMMGMMEVPQLYPEKIICSATLKDFTSTNAASHLRSILASEAFDKTGLLAAHGAAICTAVRTEKEQLKGHGLCVKVMPSVVEMPPRPPTPLAVLSPISLLELQLGRHHHGFVLYGTLCAKAFKMTAVMTLLEDGSGHTVKLALYNATRSTSTIAQVQEQFPEGQRVAIKEPYFKRYNDHTVGLRVNNPGDIIFMSPQGVAANTNTRYSNYQHCDTPVRDTWPSPPKGHLPARNLPSGTPLDYDTLRAEGNRQFKKHNWAGAIDLYSESIRGVSTILCNGPIPSPMLIQYGVGTISPIFSDCSHSLTLSKRCLANSNPKGGQGNSQKNTPSTERLQSMGQVPMSELAETTSKQGKKSTTRIGQCVHSGSCDSASHSAALLSPGSVQRDRTQTMAALLSAYSNRSEAYLRLQEYELALNDAEKAISLDPTHVKSLFRKGRALQGLEQYAQAVVCLQTAVCFSPNDTDLQISLKECLSSELQSWNDVHHDDLSRYYLSNFSGQAPPCADFVGPIEIQQLQSQVKSHPQSTFSPPCGLGRGIFLSRAVEAGELLLVSNALAVARVHGGSIEFHLDPATQKMNDASQEDLVTQLCQLASSCPKALLQLYSLYDGSLESHMKTPSMELFTPCNSCPDYGLAGSNSNSNPMLTPAIIDISDRALVGVSAPIKSVVSPAAFLRSGSWSKLSTRTSPPFTATSSDNTNTRHICSWSLPKSSADSFGSEPRVAKSTIDSNFSTSDWEYSTKSCSTVHTKSQSDGEIRGDGCRSSTGNSGLVFTPAHAGCATHLPSPNGTIAPGYGILPGSNNLQPDITRIRQIVQLNAFDEDGSIGKNRKRAQFAGTESAIPSSSCLKGSCSGLWALPSFINHSCLANASRVHVGDAMLIYASRDMDVGEEVCLPYFDILCPLQQRKNKGVKGWGFQCKCSRCLLEEGMQPNLAKVYTTYTELEEQAMQARMAAPACIAPSFLENKFVAQSAPFVSLAHNIQRMLEKIDQDMQLDPMENHWIHASYAIAYLAGHQSMVAHRPPQTRILSIQTLLEAMMLVNPGNSQTLKTAALLTEEHRKLSGNKSPAFKLAEEKTLQICRCIFGWQKPSVLRSLIKASLDGLLDP